VLDYLFWGVLALVGVSSAVHNVIKGAMVARTRATWFVLLAVGLALVLLVLSFVPLPEWKLLGLRV
jgi:predicted MFS family arabinose efflux permease